MPGRLGPRPLPLHLASAATALMTSRGALPLLRAGSLPWRPEFSAAASALEQNLAASGCWEINTGGVDGGMGLYVMAMVFEGLPAGLLTSQGMTRM